MPIKKKSYMNTISLKIIFILLFMIQSLIFKLRLTTYIYTETFENLYIFFADSVFACVFFRLQIDSNYMAVILIILGYSLNDTLVTYDRIRENEKFNPYMEIGQLVNMSVNKVMIRNIVTTVTTILAVVTIIAVAEIYGLTSLRTFAIPMAFGLLSGTISSLFVSAPLWVVWKKARAKKAK